MPRTRLTFDFEVDTLFSSVFWCVSREQSAKQAQLKA
jgi:hypothetical protein